MEEIEAVVKTAEESQPVVISWLNSGSSGDNINPSSDGGITSGGDNINPSGSITANTTPKYENEHNAHGYKTDAIDMTEHNPTTDDSISSFLFGVGSAR